MKSGKNTGIRMDIYNWMNRSLPDLVEKLEKNITEGYHVETEDSLGISGRLEIYEILDGLLAVLFPGSYCREKIELQDVNFFINDTLRNVSFKFIKHLKSAFKFRCKEKDCGFEDCDKRAEEALIHLLESLDDIRSTLLKDVETAYKGDPAASSFDEIILSYPYVDAISTYRIAHTLYCLSVPIIPRIMSERAHSRTGIDIHPGAEIQPGFFIDHGTGVVIGETCRIGRNVKIYQGVTLGALSPFDKKGVPIRDVKRHPDIEDDVIIYSNATILGGNTTIGKGSIIGGNTWTVKSVPAGSIVYRETRLSSPEAPEGE